MRVVAKAEPAIVELSDAADANAFFTRLAGQAERGHLAFAGNVAHADTEPSCRFGGA